MKNIINKVLGASSLVLALSGCGKNFERGETYEIYGEKVVFETKYYSVQGLDLSANILSVFKDDDIKSMYIDNINNDLKIDKIAFYKNNSLLGEYKKDSKHLDKNLFEDLQKDFDDYLFKIDSIKKNKVTK